MTDQKKALLHVIISSILATSAKGMERYIKPKDEKQYLIQTLTLLKDVAGILQPEYREGYLEILEEMLKPMGVDMFHGNICLN